MDWTAERVSALTRLWQEGLSASQVADQLGGVSRSGVLGKLHRLGLSGREAPSRPRAAARSPVERPKRQRPTIVTVRAVKRSETPAPSVQLPVVELDPTASIFTLTPAGCRWPIGDPTQSDFGYCGRQRGSQMVYCAHHTQVAFRRSPTSKARGGGKIENRGPTPRFYAQLG